MNCRSSRRSSSPGFSSRFYLTIVSGDGELKLTTPADTGGTLSPMPFAYVAPVEP